MPPRAAPALPNRVEIHDAGILATARAVLDACADPRAMGAAVAAAVERNAEWRGRHCINLLAPEAPTSPAVRALLAAEIGTRAAEGHIGAVNRWFAGTRHIDEVEALCVELMKRYFRCNYADHRLCASMIGNAVVYTALTRPGDVVMSAAQPFGAIRRTGPTARPGRWAATSSTSRWIRRSSRSTSTPSAPLPRRCGRGWWRSACR